MKHFFLLCFITLISSSCKQPSQKQTESKEIVLEVNFTRSYCLGMRPTQEILEEYEKTLPYNGLIRIVEKSTEKAQEITLDNSGKATIKLNKGEYEVFSTQKIQSTYNEEFGESCSSWLKKPSFTIEFDGEQSVIKKEFHENCNPCEYPAP